MEDFYAPKGNLLWDSWFIKEQDTFHAFYLQAEITDDPEERHNNNVAIGHAASKDLVIWEELPIALTPGEKGEWDDLSLWTGSVVKKDDTYFLFYTGRNQNPGNNWIQKIGLATSDDMITWQKEANNPILEADEKYYAMDNSENKLGKIAAWRDPFVFKDPNLGKYFMTISARAEGENSEYNGCVALASSEDLYNWETHPPILSPGKYDEMEITQLIYHEGLYYLFFGVSGKGLYEPSWEQEVGDHSGLHCYYSDDIYGGYKPVNGNGVVVDGADKIYDVRLVERNGSEFTALGWLNRDEQDKFIGKMSHPFKITLDGSDVKVN